MNNFPPKGYYTREQIIAILEALEFFRIEPPNSATLVELDKLVQEAYERKADIRNIQ